MAPLATSSPKLNWGASSKKKGPNTVGSVQPWGLSLFMATVSMDKPKQSLSKMNSWRFSSHIWPVAVR